MEKFYLFFHSNILEIIIFKEKLWGSFLNSVMLINLM